MGQPWVAVRGFDIDDRVERLVREGQVVGIALHEIQAVQVVCLTAEIDPGLVQIHTRVGIKRTRDDLVDGELVGDHG